MTPADGENGIGLDSIELRIVALRELAKRAAHAEDWLLWEDMPAFSEDTFTQLDKEVRSLGDELIKRAAHIEHHYDIDGQHILEQAQR